MSTSPWSLWRQHYTQRAHRPRPTLGEAPPLTAPQRATLLRSLAIFQLGESGEGRIVAQVDRSGLPCIDDDYRVALTRFVAEEGRHAAILAEMVRGLGGRTLHRTWTEGLFRHARRAMGIRLKLLVLLAAEVIGVTFYSLLAARLSEGPWRAALDEICADESHHLSFHAAFFRVALPGGLGRLAFSLAWWSVATAACAVVAWDHRRTLRAFGIPVATLWSRCGRALARAHAESRSAPVREEGVVLGVV